MMGDAGPYRHDTAVPIIFWWPGAKPQTRVLPVATTSIVPTLANVIGVNALDLIREDEPRSKEQLQPH